ncbi:Metallo-dependent hydrolase [Exidia glandulosa HHB12029]|uniref:Metallo-dependent hydrolase n=1 Tax=Exidia glandulosa HHB12029 TaxID=1314781 RepID=A0A165KRN2_EXIGL|nr:Metallo-dependent hydrolase [Exidia glandulosa HHB12029]
MIRDLLIDNVVLADGSKAAVVCHDGLVSQIDPPCAFVSSGFHRRLDGDGGLLVPSLCHSHIHLDKCDILDKCPLHDGSFEEALRVTGEAKANFTTDDLITRGRNLIQQSVKFGVTAMRAHVEVDDMVKFMCLEAGIQLSKASTSICDVQICAFAQEPIISHPENAELLHQACTLYTPAISAIGSAPYVEPSDELAVQNVDLLISLAITHHLHLDFHLDYNLSPSRPPLIHAVIAKLHAADWTHANPGRTIVIGHATRLTLFSELECEELRREVGELPVHFIGLPQSDVYMMGRERGSGGRPRGTLDVLQMQRDGINLNAALSVNNVGNAFTPQGNGDPLGLCTLGVALYQNATPAACQVLLEAVSTRSKAAIGLGYQHELDTLQPEGPSFGDFPVSFANGCIQGAVLSPSETRATVKSGRVVAWRRVSEWDAMSS